MSLIEPVGTPVDELLQMIVQRWDQRLTAQEPGPFDSCRVLHGRGGCFPGLEWFSLDVHWPAVMVTLYQAPPKQFLAGLRAVLLPRMIGLELSALLVQSRYEPGAPYAVAWGEVPVDLVARRDNLEFGLSLQQQNPGFFLDMEPGRQWLEERSTGKRVLNLFAYTCAFSVVAQAAGAESVVNVDMSSRSLAVGRENHRRNQLPTDNIVFMAENIMKSWGRIRRRGPFDIIVIDPPSFQRGSFTATRDYAKVLRRIPELAVNGAHVLACLNAPELGECFLRELVSHNSPGCALEQRLPAHKDFPDVDSGRRLKLLSYTYCSDE